MTEALNEKDLRLIDGYWRAANYLSVGQIYLRANPLLTEPLTLDHVKSRLLGHWGTTPGLNFIYAHLNRLIGRHDINMLLVCGPGHGGPGIVANAYLEGTYSEVYPDITQDTKGLERLFRQFSYPGGISSHVGADVPGSIHEGGELGYSLMHAYGAAFDNPDLVVACVVGDGEAETGALAASWHANKFLNPARDGAVLPILHLNGYKIASPTMLSRISHAELDALLRGYGHVPYFVEGNDPATMHRAMAKTLEDAWQAIQTIQDHARGTPDAPRPAWPMIVLRSPKGWTGPVVDGVATEGSWRSHQVPLTGLAETPGHIDVLAAWMKSYRPEDLFDAAGRLVPELRALPPTGARRMSANPHANGGLLLQDLRLPRFEDYALPVPAPGGVEGEATKVAGAFLRDVIAGNGETFRLFGPDETESNRLGAVFETTGRVFMDPIRPQDRQLARDGRVMEILSEQICQGWLEGYLLTGRHGLMSCYEAFIHIVDSMVNQHAKWLKVSHDVPWRKSIASLNYILTSHVWRQDHNGFSHQDPGFIDHVVNKKAGIVRVYLPPDANTLLSVLDHCLRSRDYINVIVAGKQKQAQWLDRDAAIGHCRNGLGVWEWASTCAGAPPDAVIACAGDVPTLEALAATQLLVQHFPDIRLRFVNVVDLMALQAPSQHPHGLDDRLFDAMFTPGIPVVFAYHGYPSLIHRLTYRRRAHDSFHVHGYQEEGTTTTPFDMTVLNRLDRFHLALSVVNSVARLAARRDAFAGVIAAKLAAHDAHIRAHGEDLPEIRDWAWTPLPTAPDAPDEGFLNEI